MAIKPKYDVVILGGGHNGLVSAAYLARAGLSVLLLEKNDYLGGAATSKQVFPDYDARLSRYAYLISLLPRRIMQDLGLNITLRRRSTGSFTPYVRNGQHKGLLLSNVSDEISRHSLRQLTGSDAEFKSLQRFYALTRTFAEKTWRSMLEPLRSRAAWAAEFRDETEKEAWRSLVEEPAGRMVERYLQDDLVRGVVFTDAKIGLFTNPDDSSLLQNRCLIYHTIGDGTGEWKVPVGGMGTISGELIRVARERGATLRTNVDLRHLEPGTPKSVQFEIGGESHTVECRFLLVNFGRNILASMLGAPEHAEAADEGSVLKINMLLERLPTLRAADVSAHDAFCGTFHIDEGYQEMKQSYAEANGGKLPRKIPCEMYCHTLTDDSILSPELRARGFHTLTLFALDTPWRLFVDNNDSQRKEAAQRCLAGLNAYLAEPIENCLVRDRMGALCLEAKTPVDIEQELGHYRGNIFHRALTFPFGESAEEVGSWGVETEFENVFICGSSAIRGGAVSGIPGHNAAMKVLEASGIKKDRAD